MMNLNNVTISGRLAADPMYYDGGATRFTVAINRKWTGKDGAKQEECCFADCEAWNELGKQVAKLTKGFPVCIEGALKLNKWKDKEGKDRHQMVVLAFRVHWLEHREAAGEPAATSGNPTKPATVKGGFDDEPAF